MEVERITSPDLPEVTNPELVAIAMQQLERRRRIALLRRTKGRSTNAALSDLARLALDLLLDVCAQELLPVLGRAPRIQVSTETDPNDGFEVAFATVFACTSDGRKGTLLFDPPAARAVADALAHNLAGWRGDGLPTEAEAGLLEYAALRLADSLLMRLPESAFQFTQFAAPQTIDEIEASHGGDVVEIHFSAGIRSGRIRLCLPGLADASALPEADSLATAWPEVAAASCRERAAFDVRLALSPITLACEEYECMEPGDVLLTGRRSLDGCGPIDAVVSTAGLPLASACILEDTPTLVTVECGPPSAGFAEAETGSTHESIVEGLVRLVPLLASGRLTPEQVSRWPSGSVLSLVKGRERPVELVVDGECVGLGEMVCVEGELGIRVLERYAVDGGDR